MKLAPTYGRLLLICGSLLIAVSHAVMWLVVARVDAPVWWQFGVPLLIGGLGLGLAAPPLVNVILAGVPVRSAGSASGVLSTVNQIGGSAGVAFLGTLFFTHVASASNGSGQTAAFSAAFAAILPWQIGLYLLAAALMTLLPAGASAK